MRITTAFFLAAIMLGCETYQWTKADFDQAQYDKDVAECQYEARKAVPDNGFGNPWMIGAERAQINDMCMRTRGYQ